MRRQSASAFSSGKHHLGGAKAAQGPVRTLQGISDELISRRGVISGNMHLIADLMPQVHAFIRALR